jgi:hypothetical protein
LITTLIYSSLAEESVLLARLRNDPPFSRLFTTLYRDGHGPFDLSGHDEDIDRTVEDLVGRGLLGSFGGIEVHLRELRVELARTERAFPGTAGSRMLLEMDPGLLEQRLMEDLERTQADVAGKLVITLLYGAGRMAPDIFQEKEEQLYLVPLPAVQYGARILARVNEDDLFPGDERSARFHRQQFGAWRDFYLSAAGRGDVVLVYMG